MKKFDNKGICVFKSQIFENRFTKKYKLIKNSFFDVSESKGYPLYIFKDFELIWRHLTKNLDPGVNLVCAAGVKILSFLL